MTDQVGAPLLTARRPPSMRAQGTHYGRPHEKLPPAAQVSQMRTAPDAEAACWYAAPTHPDHVYHGEVNPTLMPTLCRIYTVFKLDRFRRGCTPPEHLPEIIDGARIHVVVVALVAMAATYSTAELVEAAAPAPPAPSGSSLSTAARLSSRRHCASSRSRLQVPRPRCRL